MLQIFLLGCPLALLAGLGVYLIVQDKASVEREAREKIEGMVSALLKRLWNAETNFETAAYNRLEVPWPDGTLSFRVDTNFALLFPPPLRKASGEPDPTSSLSNEHKSQWMAAQRAEFLTNDLEGASRIWTSLIGILTNGSHRTIARFQRAVVLERLQRTNDAVAVFMALADDDEATLSSGIPVGNLAAGKLLVLANQFPGNAGEEMVRRAITNLLSHPSEFTRPLLTGVKSARYEQILTEAEKCLEQQDAARHLYALYRVEAPKFSGRVKRFGQENDEWWTFREGSNVFARNRSNMIRLAETAVREAQLPGYTRATLRQADEILWTDQLTLAGQDRDFVAGTSRWVGMVHPDGALQCTVDLTHPEVLYALQRQRAWLFGGVLGLATASACFGIFYAQRAFRRQEHLSDLKSNFVSSVSHELRAPLASMRLISEGLQSGRASSREKTSEYYNFLVQECRRLSSLVENVLDFSRIEQNRQTYDPRPADLRAVCGGALQTMAPVAAERQVTLLCDSASSAGDEFVAEIDAAAMQRAVVNLLDNAVKHSPAGGTVRLRYQALPSEFLISVEDHGPGIPLHEQKRIFERFYRVGPELRRDTPGVGIGLSIVKHIVEAHGGSVTVKSSPGEGAIFSIHLPGKRHR